jgi:hypothetical protein
MVCITRTLPTEQYIKYPLNLNSLQFLKNSVESNCEDFQVYLRNFCAMREVAMVGPNVIIAVWFCAVAGRLDKLI